MAASTIVQWLTQLPIPWLVGNTNGAADATSYGTVLDSQVDQLKQATKARFPDYAPSDALPQIGGDRGLIQGPAESDADFITRLKFAWDTWANAGTPGELIAQLYWYGFPDAYIVQQNGLAYNLSGAPTPGVDPNSLVVRTVLQYNVNLTSNPVQSIVVTITTAGVLGTMKYKVAVGGGTQSAAISTTATTDYAASLGTTNTWAIFAAGTYVLNSTYTFHVDGTITRTGGAIDTVTQNSTPWFQLDPNNYFTSRFIVLFPSPVTISAAQLSILSTIINQWRPGEKTCDGIVVIESGNVWGWGGHTWGQAALNWGGSSVSNYPVNP